jgi:hypothetical protein
MPRVDVVDPWVRAMSPENPPALALVPISPLPPISKLGDTNINQTGSGTIVKVKQLPNVPEVVEAKARKGRTHVAVLQELAKAPGQAQDPNAPPVPQPVVLPVINQGPDGKFALPEGWAAADRYWTVYGGKFPAKEIVEEFKKAGIPDYLHQAVAVMVEMERIEVDPVTGNPLPDAKPVKVKPIPMNAPPHDPWKDTENFLNWILQGQQAQAQMLQPPFHPFLVGDMWAPPMAEDPVDPNVQITQQQKRTGKDFIDPTTKIFDHEQAYQYWKSLQTPKEKNEFWDTLEPKDKAKLTKMRQEEEQEAARQRAQQNQSNQNNRGNTNRGNPNRSGGNQPFPRGGSPAPRGGREYQAQDNQLVGEMLASGRPSGTPFPRGGGPRRGGWEQPWVPPGAPGREGVPNEGGWQPQPGQQWQGGNLTLDEKGRMDVWAIDETAEPGKCYKYRIRVLIKNPLYGMTNVAEDPKLEKVPYLPADPEKNWTPWSEKITVPSNLDIQFVDQGALPNTRTASVGVNIKRWQNGKDNKTNTPEKVQAGDMIGKKVGEVDYTTGYTVVDIRRVGGDVRVRIMDKDGNVMVRSVNADKAHPAFKDAPKPPPGPNNEAIGQGPNPRGGEWVPR